MSYALVSPERWTVTWKDWPVTKRQHQCFCLAGSVVPSGFCCVFMILAVWVVCLCLDNSSSQRL